MCIQSGIFPRASILLCAFSTTIAPALTLHEGWPVKYLGAGLYAFANVGDIDGDGNNEIVLFSQAGGFFDIHVLDSEGMARPPWPQRRKGNGFKAVTLFDIDGDGSEEIFASTIRGILPDKGGIDAFHFDASAVTGFPFEPSRNSSFLHSPLVYGFDLMAGWVDNTNSSFHLAVRGGGSGVNFRAEIPARPNFGAVGDIDGDGRDDALFATLADSAVYAYGTPGILPGWPYRGAITTLSLGNFDSTKPGLEVVAVGDHELHLIDGAGRSFAGYPFGVVAPEDSGVTHPALADIDRDGALDIVVANHDGWVWALQHTPAGPVPLPGFPVAPMGPGSFVTGVVVADVDSLPGCELVLGVFADLPYLVVLDAGGEQIEGSPFRVRGHPTTPSVADVDGDGLNEIALTTFGNEVDFTGRVYVWDTAAAAVPGTGWPLRNHDRWNSGAESYQGPPRRRGVPPTQFLN